MSGNSMNNTHISSVVIVTLNPLIRVVISGCSAGIALNKIQLWQLLGEILLGMFPILTVE